jgi:hypothetical protein
LKKANGKFVQMLAIGALDLEVQGDVFMADGVFIGG